MYIFCPGTMSHYFLQKKQARNFDGFHFVCEKSFGMKIKEPLFGEYTSIFKFLMLFHYQNTPKS